MCIHDPNSECRIVVLTRCRGCSHSHVLRYTPIGRQDRATPMRAMGTVDRSRLGPTDGLRRPWNLGRRSLGFAHLRLENFKGVEQCGPHAPGQWDPNKRPEYKRPKCEPTLADAE